MKVKDIRHIIQEIETDIQSINAFIKSGTLEVFYKETFLRTIKHLESYKESLQKAIEEADIN